MGAIKRFLGMEDDDISDNILEENRQLKRKRKATIKELDELKEQKDEITTKYIELLEEKAKGFDQYLYFQNLYGETYSQLKEQKREMAELKGENKRLNEEVEHLTSSNDKKSNKIDKLNKKIEKMTEVQDENDKK